MMQSIVRECGAVSFPAFTGERVYMHEFRMENGLPENLKRWQETVDQMLVGVDTDGPIYLMIDQKAVKAQVTHRRPGMHVDGYWNPNGVWQDQKPWNAISAGHRPAPSGPRHNARPGHGPRPTPRHVSCSGTVNGMWKFDPNDRPEAIILASDICASRGLIGEFEGLTQIGGDVSHLDLSHVQEIILRENRVYQGNVSFIHESLPVLHDCNRTLVRLNVPGHVVH